MTTHEQQAQQNRTSHDTRYCDAADWHKCAACVRESQAFHTTEAHDAEGRYWRYPATQPAAPSERSGVAVMGPSWCDPLVPPPPRFVPASL